MTTDFESDLRAKMAGIKPVLPPGLAQEVAASHRRHQQRRRKATRALMAAVPAVALVAGAAAVAAHGADSASPATTHPAVLTAAYVKTKVESTLSSHDYVVEATGNAFFGFNSAGSIGMVGGESGTSNTTWTDLVTGNSEGVAKLSATDTRTTWEIGKQPNEKVVIIDPATKTVMYGAYGGDFNPEQYASPSQLKQFLATSQVTIAGKSVINGQSLVDLRLIDRTGDASEHADFWVNAQTFQVVKFVVNLPTNLAQASGGKSTSYTSYYQWLPRTKSLVTQVNTPQIPAGYRQVEVGGVTPGTYAAVFGTSK